MTPTILTVDDSPANLAAIAAILADGYDVRVATSGEQALELADQLRPDLILLDVMMPGLDGYETCQRLKQLEGFEDVPIIFLTALSQPEDEIRCFEMGGSDFVSKPFNPTVLRARVKTHVQLRQYLSTFKTLAIRDGLTGLFNRKYFDDRLDKEWRACKREHEPLSLLLMDVDHFKLFNDTYGHQASDVCLVAVGDIIRSKMRRGRDMAARYGGEEFVCVLPNTRIEDACQIAERIRESIQALGIEHGASSTARVVTASIGVACAVGFEDAAPADLLKLADDCLYQAKKTGRNRVCRAG
ncbi:diguanylate cyclase [Thauera aromatica]|uniref:diguanylate cyclase n=1 Tax=Thauera aromatica TaxID=59405 RepID=UPI001FFDDCBC|nr:diguanylate cyclase [Thauera aromatica]MCK2086854.1 diguanylate cyclase [Thauera aromatica]